MISESIATILREVLEREGWPAYTNHPQDRGGPTKGGITQRTLEQWRQRRCTRQELKRLDEGEALRILYRRYVETNGIYRLTDAVLQEQVIDDAVHSGPRIAVKDLQTTLDVTADGIIGSITLGAIDSYTEAKELHRKIAMTRALRLAKFVQKNPDQLVFLVGWLRRALSFVN
jgi:lysozyme family protein